MPVIQFHSAAQSISHKTLQGAQPVSARLLAEALPLAERHHDLTERDVQSQRFHRQSWADCRLLRSEQQHISNRWCDQRSPFDLIRVSTGYLLRSTFFLDLGVSRIL